VTWWSASFPSFPLSPFSNPFSAQVLPPTGATTTLPAGPPRGTTMESPVTGAGSLVDTAVEGVGVRGEVGTTGVVETAAGTGVMRLVRSRSRRFRCVFFSRPFFPY
jgi:hypothetical protein